MREELLKELREAIDNNVKHNTFNIYLFVILLYFSCLFFFMIISSVSVIILSHITKDHMLVGQNRNRRE